MRNKKQFASIDLLRKGFHWVEDSIDGRYLVFKPKGHKGKFLITNDYSIDIEDSWFVDYGLHDPITNLTESLVDDFIANQKGTLAFDDWLENLVGRV